MSEFMIAEWTLALILLPAIVVGLVLFLIVTVTLSALLDVLPYALALLLILWCIGVL